MVLPGRTKDIHDKYGQQAVNRMLDDFAGTEIPMNCRQMVGGMKLSMRRHEQTDDHAMYSSGP